MELTGDSQDNPLLASSLQTAHNLSVLPSLVESLVTDLTEAVSRKIKACFDMASLAREVGGKGRSSATSWRRTILTPVVMEDSTNSTSAFVYKSRARNEPTNVTMPQWTAAMWTRLEYLISDLGAVCIRVRQPARSTVLDTDGFMQAYTLEKVLKLKKDANTQASFLDEAMSVRSTFARLNASY